eukprot:gene14355-17322_t
MHMIAKRRRAAAAPAAPAARGAPGAFEVDTETDDESRAGGAAGPAGAAAVRTPAPAPARAYALASHALSVRQPWAAAIAAGQKKWENRDFKTQHEWLWLHVVLEPAAGVCEEAVAFVNEHASEAVAVPVEAFGCIIGAIKVCEQHLVGVDASGAPEYVRQSPWVLPRTPRSVAWQIKFVPLPRQHWFRTPGHEGTWPVAANNHLAASGRAVDPQRLTALLDGPVPATPPRASWVHAGVELTLDEHPGPVTFGEVAKETVGPGAAHIAHPIPRVGICMTRPAADFTWDIPADARWLQARALRRVAQLWHRVSRMTVCAPCGAGKTRIIAYLVSAALRGAEREGAPRAVHTFFPALSLIEQTVQGMQEHIHVPGLMIIVNCSRERIEKKYGVLIRRGAEEIGDEIHRALAAGRPVLAVHTYASAHKVATMLAMPRFAAQKPLYLTINDEAHHGTIMEKQAAGAGAGAPAQAALEAEVASYRAPFLDNRIPVRHSVSLTATPVCVPEVQTRQLSFDRDFGPFADIVTLAEATRRRTIAPWTVDVLEVGAAMKEEDVDEDMTKQMFARVLRRVLELTRDDQAPKCISFHGNNTEAFEFAEYARRLLRNDSRHAYIEHVYSDWKGAESRGRATNLHDELVAFRMERWTQAGVFALVTNVKRLCEGVDTAVARYVVIFPGTACDGARLAQIVGRIQRFYEGKQPGKVLLIVQTKEEGDEWKDAYLGIVARLNDLRVDGLTDEQFVRLFERAAERADKQKEKKPAAKQARRSGGVDAALPPNTEQWPEDAAALDSLLRNLPDIDGNEDLFVQYVDSLRARAAALPGGLCDVEQQWVDAEGRRVGLWWALTKIRMKRGTLPNMARRAAILRARLGRVHSRPAPGRGELRMPVCVARYPPHSACDVAPPLPSGPGFPATGLTRVSRQQQWEDMYAAAEHAVQLGDVLLELRADRSSQLGSWMRHQAEKSREENCPELRRLEMLEPAGLFLDVEAQWHWYHSRAKQYKGSGGSLDALAAAKGQAQNCNLGGWYAAQKRAYATGERRAVAANRREHPRRFETLRRLDGTVFVA